MKKQEETLFKLPPIDPAADKKNILMKGIAWQVFPINEEYDIRKLAFDCDLPITKTKLYLKELEQEGKLLPFSKPNSYTKYYILPASTHMQLLEEIRKDPGTFLYKKIDTYSWSSTSWKQAIQAYIQAGTDGCARYITSSLTETSVITLLAIMPGYPGWTPFFRLLPTSCQAILFAVLMNRYVLQLKEPDMELVNKGYLENNDISQEIRDDFREQFAFIRYVLPARLNEIPETFRTGGPMYQCMYALWLQYQGKVSEALKHYQQSLKDAPMQLFRNPLYGVCYVWALARDTSASSRKKLESLRKNKTILKDPFLLPVHLLLDQVLGEKPDSHMDNFVQWEEDLPALPRILGWLIIRHFHLNDNMKINDEKVLSVIGEERLKLLQLECSQDFMPFITRAADLSAQTGLSPLFPVCAKKEEWEKVLEQLIEKTRMKDEIKKESGGRIVYQISGESIIPRLQKSKDGITWSKGRNIALSTFRAGLPEMNDTDRLVANHIKCYKGGWGFGEFWELSGPAALAELAGYPLVFSESHPDTPVTITCEVPQVTVTKVRNGFRIENNTGNKQLATRIILQKENDFLYHIIKLTTKQQELLNILSEKKSFPPESEHKLAELLPQLSRIMTVHSDLIQNGESLKKVKADTLITVLLQPTGTGIRAELCVKPFAGEALYCKPGKGNAAVIGQTGGKRVQAIRDLKMEERNLQQVMEWLRPLSEEQDEEVFFFEEPYLCLDLLDLLGQHLDTVRIEWPQGMKLTLKSRADFKNLSLSVKGSGQWFDVEGELNIDDKTLIGIAELLRKVRESKGRFIALSEGEYLVLTEQLRKRLLALDTQLTADKENLKIPSPAAGALLDMEQLGAQLKKGKSFNALIKRIEEAEKKQYPLPTQLKAEMRDYQAEGFRWMSRLADWGAGACLADDMGLGKTLQANALMLSKADQGASLVVAPASVVLNWRNEIMRFAPSLTPLLMNENGCDRRALVEKASDHDIVITTYGLLTNLSEILAAKTWNIIVLDEAHIIKNRETKMSQSAMKLNGNFRLLLTGTPLQNHLGEIWNLFRFATPGLLGTLQQFSEKFIQPIEKEGDRNRQRQLKRLLQPFILRRTKTEVLDELPGKTEITLHVDLSEKERALYENLRREALNNLEEGSATAMQTLAEITRLRQAACHPALVHPELQLPSSKSAAFMGLVEELANNHHRSLVFSQFTSYLSLVRKELDKAGIPYLYLDGSTSIAERSKMVKVFQTGDQPLFLISLKAGGLGLNLTAADFVIHLDPWWNPAIEDQASDRAYRIGQTHPVTVYRLIATHTIEEKIIRLHRTKKSLADSLLDESNLSHKLTKEEMLELLRENEWKE